MIKKNKDLFILIQDKGISATHPIIFKKMKNKIIVCSVSNKKRYNYTIILPASRITNWLSEDVDYFLQRINNTRYFIESSAGHELALNYGVSEELIKDVKKYIKD